MDLNYMVSVAPVLNDIFLILISVGWALLLGNLVFQATKSMVSGLGFEGEDPHLLFARTFLFGFLLLVSRQVCEIGLSMTSTIIDMLQVPSSVSLTMPDESIFGIGASWLLVIIIGFVIMWQLVKLFMEIGERYVVMAFLTLSAPLAFSMGGSKSTEDIFKGWARMFGSMCVMMMFNVICLKVLISALSYMPTGPSVIPWAILVVGIARVARKIDSIITRIGLNPAITGDGLGRSLPGMFTYAVIRSIGATLGKTIGKQGGGRQTPSGGRPNGPNGGSGGPRTAGGRGYFTTGRTAKGQSGRPRSTVAGGSVTGAASTGPVSTPASPAGMGVQPQPTVPQGTTGQTSPSDTAGTTGSVTKRRTDSRAAYGSVTRRSSVIGQRQNAGEVRPGVVIPGRAGNVSPEQTPGTPHDAEHLSPQRPPIPRGPQGSQPPAPGKAGTGSVPASGKSRTERYSSVMPAPGKGKAPGAASIGGSSAPMRETPPGTAGSASRQTEVSHRTERRSATAYTARTTAVSGVVTGTGGKADLPSAPASVGGGVPLARQERRPDLRGGPRSAETPVPGTAGSGTSRITQIPHMQTGSTPARQEQRPNPAGGPQTVKMPPSGTAGSGGASITQTPRPQAGGTLARQERTPHSTRAPHPGASAPSGTAGSGHPVPGVPTGTGRVPRSGSGQGTARIPKQDGPVMGKSIPAKDKKYRRKGGKKLG